MGDMSGQTLNTKLVREAKIDEVDKFAHHNVYAKRPMTECV